MIGRAAIRLAGIVCAQGADCWRQTRSRGTRDPTWRLGGTPRPTGRRWNAVPTRRTLRNAVAVGGWLKRRLAEIEPDQPESGSRIEWQAGQDADTALAELPQACDWGSKRDAHGKPKYWKGVKLHAEVTREGGKGRLFCSITQFFACGHYSKIRYCIKTTVSISWPFWLP